jgi:hypothetical protein
MLPPRAISFLRCSEYRKQYTDTSITNKNYQVLYNFGNAFSVVVNARQKSLPLGSYCFFYAINARIKATFTINALSAVVRPNGISVLD